jgi:hypothetical protein
MPAADWGDVATWVSGVATTTAVAFAGLQLREFRRRDSRDRRVELAGVSVEWRLERPPDPPTADGITESPYVFTLQNPGRLPVTHVSVHISLPLAFRLVHPDGRVEEPRHHFELDTPVVAGSGTRQWWRTLRFAYADREGLRNMSAVVRFRDADGIVHENPWGRPHGVP